METRPMTPRRGRSTQLTLGLLLLPVALAAQVTRNGAYLVRSLEGSIPVHGSRHLKIISSGRVEVVGNDSAEVAYKLDARIRGNGPVERAVLDGIHIKTRTQGAWTYLIVAVPAEIGLRPHLAVRVPKSLEYAVVRSVCGDVQVTGVDGAVDAETGGGRIQMDRIGQNASARTGGGEIRLGQIGGAVRCHSLGGSIQVERFTGESELETAGGEISVVEAFGPVRAVSGGGNIRIDDARSWVNAHTDGGLVEIGRVAGRVIATTAGGPIRIGSAGGASCESGSGAIRLKNVTGRLAASTSRGSIWAAWSDAQPLEASSLSTGDGDITVWIPSNLAVTVRAGNQNAGRPGRLISDFRELRPGLAELLAPRPAMAEGALNGGGPLLRLTCGGTIYLRRAH